MPDGVTVSVPCPDASVSGGRLFAAQTCLPVSGVSGVSPHQSTLRHSEEDSRAAALLIALPRLQATWRWRRTCLSLCRLLFLSSASSLRLQPIRCRSLHIQYLLFFCRPQPVSPLLPTVVAVLSSPPLLSSFLYQHPPTQFHTPNSLLPLRHSCLSSSSPVAG